MGSVKDLSIIEPATKTNPGIGRFTFSDRYSVFDWGEMPDQIPDKGTAIALLGSYFLEQLQSVGIPTHLRGLVADDTVYSLFDLPEPSNIQEVELFRVIKPELKGETYDYSHYTADMGGILIPLEIIYRNSLPAGSSVFKRLDRGDITPQDLGLNAMPVADQRLDEPILDVSTKLEITDRYLTWDEAQRISALAEDELFNLKQLTMMINQMISTEFEKIGLVNEDGKIEVAFNHGREIVVVDVLGTLDECRFTYNGVPVSKEIARIHYRGSEWHKAIEKAKKEDRQHWKEICPLQPEPLPADLKNAIANVYRSVTNQITGREWFPDVPAFHDVMHACVRYMNV